MENRESSQVRGGCDVPVPRVSSHKLMLVRRSRSIVPDKIAANRSHQLRDSSRDLRFIQSAQLLITSKLLDASRSALAVNWFHLHE